MELHVGTSGYAYREWKNKFYPADLPAKGMLHYYSQHFRSVEINNSFYQMPKPVVLEGWAREVPPDFSFAFKAPQRITHFQQLRNSGDNVTYFFEVLATLHARLGPVLFQLPPAFHKNFERLRSFLEFVHHAPYRMAFEFRHPSWFDDEVYGLLREHNVALCIAEADDAFAIPLVETTEWGYLRLRRSDYRERELRQWLTRIGSSRWQEAFVFFKHEDEGRGPELARRFMELHTQQALAKAA